MSWRMPAETEPHERTWMAWPTAAYTLGETEASADEAWSSWSRVANAIAEHEPVVMLTTPSGRRRARRRLSATITLHETELDDAWYRDTGPTFVINEAGELGAVDWAFNGWGEQDWARWEADARAGQAAITATMAARISSPLVNEGGGIHTDGHGTFLVTETVQLDPNRNPGWDPCAVEVELQRTVGARKVIWLPRGLTRDTERYGTRGHVDLLATFPSPGILLAHDQRNPDHPDHKVTDQLIDQLTGQTDADGRPLTILRLPAPRKVRDPQGFVDYSYVNHYVVNSAVIACTFNDPADAEALEILAEAYPGRRIVPIDARALFARGGGIHCITQQQPATPTDR
jgi:agmatine deiminase